MIGNDTPQGSVICLIFFISMINDVFSKVPAAIGGSLFVMMEPCGKGAIK